MNLDASVHIKSIPGPHSPHTMVPHEELHLLPPGGYKLIILYASSIVNLIILKHVHTHQNSTVTYLC